MPLVRNASTFEAGLSISLIQKSQLLYFAMVSLGVIISETTPLTMYSAVVDAPSARALIKSSALLTEISSITGSSTTGSSTAVVALYKQMPLWLA